MYRQKNAVGNLENVGFALPGHEGLYNVLMMEEIQPIFAVGASAVTKLVKRNPGGDVRIERLAECKYPYEYLREKKSANSENNENERKRVDFIKDFFGFDS